MDDKKHSGEPSGAVREAYHGASAPNQEARAAVERKLRLRFALKKEAGE